MLKRERHNILDSLNWSRERVARKPFTYNNLDAADIVAWSPMVLK